ncbi:MAG: lipase [Firmicutes bacterium]|nr:lipase [Bacillota bacterium]
MRILCIGDSNTYGYDPRSYFGSRYSEDVRWTDLVSGFDVMNWGVNGMTVSQAISYYDDVIERSDYSFVIVMLGGNDLLTGANAEQTCERMAVLLEKVLKAKKPTLLIAPPHFREGEWASSKAEIEESKRLGKMYGELAKGKGCLFADAGSWDIDISYDGVHFSEAGHKTFAEEIEILLSSFFAELRELGEKIANN